MVIALVIVTAPKPPVSITLISPAAAVFEIAPAKVLQGAVRLHGLASSPVPETHVRVAWACAVDTTTARNQTARQPVCMKRVCTSHSPFLGREDRANSRSNQVVTPTRSRIEASTACALPIGRLLM